MLLVCVCPGTAALAQSAPYPKSTVITGISFDFSTLKEQAPGSDNWAVSWGVDDHQYTSWGDGGGFGGTNSNGRVSLGFGRIEGTKSAYTGTNLWGGVNSANTATFGGKSLGVLALPNEVIFSCASEACVNDGSGSDNAAFDSVRVYRTSYGFSDVTFTGVKFDGSDWGSRGFFSPSFLQFGKGYSGARDGYIYAYAPENKSDTWNVQKPGEISLIRVAIGKFSQKAAYEFFAGLDDSGNPMWTSDILDRRPVFSDAENGVMRTSVSYNAGLKRYILTTQQVSRLKSGNAHIGIYDAPEPWGPWTTVLFDSPWDLGLQTQSKTVFWNFSNKWLSADGKRFVMVFTGTSEDNFGTLEGDFLTDPVDPSKPNPPTNLQAN